MQKIFLIILFILLHLLKIHAQAVYVDSNDGNDTNPGTKGSPVYSIQKAIEIVSSRDNDIYVMKINPGLYILDHHITVKTQKNIAGKRIIIEASVLPDDASWKPDKMPVIKSIARKGEIIEQELFIKDNWITSFYIDASHVTIRGIKFLGYDYPVNIYYPICRLNKEKTDLSVEQCMFLADLQSSVIQVGVIAHGDSITVDHCIFYCINNAVIYWLPSAKGFKTGNSFTNSIVYGAEGTAIWTGFDKGYVFKNNIITDCNFVWVNQNSDSQNYCMENCVVVNNKIFQADGNLKPIVFVLNESNNIKKGDVQLRMINNVFEPWPIDHLHIIPNTLGYEIGAGLFKNKKPDNL